MFMIRARFYISDSSDSLLELGGKTLIHVNRRCVIEDWCIQENNDDLDINSLELEVILNLNVKLLNHTKTLRIHYKRSVR